MREVVALEQLPDPLAANAEDTGDVGGRHERRGGRFLEAAVDLVVRGYLDRDQAADACVTFD